MEAFFFLINTRLPSCGCPALRLRFRSSALAVWCLKKDGLHAVAAVCFLDFVGSSEHSKSARVARSTLREHHLATTRGRQLDVTPLPAASEA